ncbi:uncharacterized protein LOC134179888 isoform X2 [Corticium candelabrum]|uniref:uncharacterized protein LOC134179888 isoform X2 n=1 Tax=Corticium candelabrum TaxID=121492 RepID=UPI002E258A3B|nr:uncharacterized protein LOC134179888 isoform X2 [Corticium candelabrum]
MSSTIVFSLLSVIAAFGSGVRGQCQQGWSFFSGNCYKFVASQDSFVGEPVTATWSDARMTCLRLGGDLASVHTPAENDFIRRESRQDVWIGYNENRSGHNPPLQFQWSDGTSTSYDYMNWAHRQPHYSTNGHSNHMLGCAYLTKGVLTRRRRQQSSANHVYNHPGQWYASSQCSTIKKQYVCKRPACCYDIRTAVADLVPNLDTKVEGTVTFQQNTLGGPTVVRGVISGLKPRSKHGFHIHESSNQSNGCLSYGGHYNPHYHPHGGPNDGNNRHVGDLGNIIADENGVASFTIHEESLVTLYGPTTVLGRGVVVHAGEDDLGKGSNIGSTTTGNAGGRLACGPIICRSCFDTLSAVANVKSDDGKATGIFTFYQVYQMGLTKQMVAYQTISTQGSYNHAQFVTIQYEDFVKKPDGKKCNALFMNNMTKEPADQVSHGHLQGRSSQRSFNTVAITSFIGAIAVYKLSHRTDEGTETQSITLCGMVWPTPYSKCACVALQANNKQCGELCFRQQTCGGPVTIEGNIKESCLSADNNVAGLSGLDYAIPADQCMDANYDRIVELPVQRDSKGTAQICGTSVGFSLKEPSSLAGRTFLLHDSHGDPVSCGVTEYRASCPKTDCQHNR